MLDWFRRLFRRSKDDARQRFFESINALNAERGGGNPTLVRKFLGTLKLRSGTLSLGDPQEPFSLEVPNIAATEIEISAQLRQYPKGMGPLTALTLKLGNETTITSRRKIGTVGIDSAKLVVLDKADLEEHWTQEGKDRIGVISTAPDDAVLRLLTKRFKLRTRQENVVRAEVVGPVSESLEKKVDDYLKSYPEYADYPSFHFRVQTNNSFDRANYMSKPWDFMPVGNAAAPLMFVCATGRGDGVYDVECGFSGEVPCVLTIDFIED